MWNHFRIFAWSEIPRRISSQCEIPCGISHLYFLKVTLYVTGHAHCLFMTATILTGSRSKLFDIGDEKHETETCRDKYSCWNMIIYRSLVIWLRFVKLSFRKSNTEVIPMCVCLRFRFVSLTAQCSQWEFAAGWLHKKNISAMLFRNEGGG